MTLRIRRVCCHSNQTRAPIANPPSSAQLGAPTTIPPSYIWVRAVVQACLEEQTHTDKHTDDHHHNTVCLAMPDVKCN